MSIRIIHTADLHFGAELKTLESKASDLQENKFKSFENLINYCTDSNNEIDMLLISGDLFDSHNPENRIKERVIEKLYYVVKRGIKLFLLPGNHDSFGYKNSIYKTENLPGVIIKNPHFGIVEEFELKGAKVAVYGGVFMPGSGTERMLAGFKVSNPDIINIGLLHGTLEMRNINVRDRDLPFSYEEFAGTGLNYLALGHFHSYKDIEIDKKHKAAYSGSLLPCKVDEYGEKYALKVDIKVSGEVQIETLKFSNIIADYKEIDILNEDIDSNEKLIENISKFSDKNRIETVVVKGVSNFPISEDEILSKLENKFFKLFIKDKTRYIDNSIIKQIKEEGTVRGLYFKKLVDKYNETQNQEQRAIIEKAISLGLQEFVKQ